MPQFGGLVLLSQSAFLPLTNMMLIILGSLWFAIVIVSAAAAILERYNDERRKRTVSTGDRDE